MNNRVMNYLLLTIIFCLLISIFIITTNKGRGIAEDLRNEFILVDFDNKDFNRINEMVYRFKEGNGDYLMLIPPTVDGGYWIHDVISNGREIIWIVDNTRDGMSTNTGKTEYKCKAIDINESTDYYNFELSKCYNFNENEKLIMVTFWKDRLQ